MVHASLACSSTTSLAGAADGARQLGIQQQMAHASLIKEGGRHDHMHRNVLQVHAHACGALCLLNPA